MLLHNVTTWCESDSKKCIHKIFSVSKKVTFSFWCMGFQYFELLSIIGYKCIFFQSETINIMYLWNIYHKSSFSQSFLSGDLVVSSSMLFSGGGWGFSLGHWARQSGKLSDEGTSNFLSGRHFMVRVLSSGSAIEAKKEGNLIHCQ